MSLRNKIVALVLGLTLALLAGLWVGLSRGWERWSSETVDRELLDRAAALGARLELDHGALELHDADELPELRDPAHPWRVVGPAAVLGGAAEVAWPEADPGAAQASVGDAAGPGGRTWRVASRSVVVEDHGRAVQAVVQIAGEAAPHRALEERFRHGLLVALAVALLVGGAGSAVLAHVSLAPLRRVAAEVDTIGAASLERRVGTDGLDPELRRVAAAFNALLARLEDAMERQRQLVSRTSHALRTPVATILTRSEVALRRDRGPEAYRAALEDVATAARESSGLVAHLLTLARLDERRGAVAREEVAVAQVAAEIARLLAPRAAEAGVTLELEIPDGLAALADRAALREALEALLDNALHYTPAGGRAGVRAFGTEAGTALTVWDTGPGIPPGERDSVLERFQRGAAAQASGHPGSGLGLAIVKAIADAHGASLALGEHAGGGLEVTLVFPRG